MDTSNLTSTFVRKADSIQVKSLIYLHSGFLHSFAETKEPTLKTLNDKLQQN